MNPDGVRGGMVVRQRGVSSGGAEEMCMAMLRKKVWLYCKSSTELVQDPSATMPEPCGRVGDKDEVVNFLSLLFLEIMWYSNCGGSGTTMCGGVKILCCIPHPYESNELKNASI
jgi:hypothetical protein